MQTSFGNHIVFKVARDLMHLATPALMASIGVYIAYL
jgi:hypothetical protein